jgi:hypothetical protein
MFQLYRVKLKNQFLAPEDENCAIISNIPMIGIRKIIKMEHGIIKSDPKGPVWGIFTLFEFALDQP